MKKQKRFIGLAIAMLALCGLVGCGGGGGSNTEAPADCAHTFKVKSDESVAATCQATGKKVEVCEKCGQRKETELKKTSHKYQTDETQSVAATCSQEGKTVKVCSVCGDKKETTVEKTEHNYVVQDGAVAATCEAEGSQKEKCSICSDEKTTTLEKVPHQYAKAEDQTGATAPSCTVAGSEVQECSMCHTKQTVDVPAVGHTFVASDPVATAGCATLTTQECSVDHVKRITWGAGDVTAETLANEHNIYQSGEGYRFWGQPIGNSIVLSEQGTATSDEHTAVPDATQVGSYFEFKINLTEAANNVKLGGELTPASYLNGTDMFKAPEDPTSSDWTYGINPDGTPITDFRYIVEVNGVKVNLDATIDTPEAGRGWYDFPATINLNAGENTIKLTMSGGWLHTWYNFGITL